MEYLYTQYALHNHGEGTGSGTSEQEGSPAQSKSDIRADYRRWQCWVPMRCGCYGGQGILGRSFSGTTYRIAEWVYSTFQCSGSTQPGFSQYLWRWWRCSESTRSRHNSHKIAVDIAALPTEECCTPIYRGTRGKNNSEAPHINDRPTPLSIFVLYFTEVVTLLVVETNRNHWCMDSFDEGPFSEPDVIEAKSFCFSR